MADIWTPPSGPAAGVSSRSEMISQRTDNIDVLSRVADGDASASTIKHRHKTGTLANRPTAGEAGRIYIPTDLHVMLIDDGTEWLIGPPLGPACEAFDDDFVATSVDAGAAEAFGFWATGIAGSGAIAISPGGALRSEVQLRTGTTSGATAVVQSKADTGFQVMLNTFLLAMTFQVNASAANGAYTIGLATSFPAYPGDPSGGLYVYKLGTGNFFAKIANASSRSTLDLGWDGLSWKTVIFEHDAGTPDVKVYLDTFNAAGLIGTLSGANMPATDAQLLLGGSARNNTTTDFRLAWDDVRLRRVR